jgi:AsmA protein
VGPNTFHFALTGQVIADPDAGRYAASGLTFRGWAGGEPLPLAGIEMLGAAELASYDSATGVAAIPRGTFNVTGIPGEFAVTFQPDDLDARLMFSVKTDSFAPRASAIAFGFPLPATADPEAYGSLQISFEGHLADGALRLEPIVGQLDDSQFNGRIVPAERLIRAEIDRIDLNRYLPPAQQRAKEEKGTLETLVERLGEFDIDAEIRVGEARVAGAKLRDMVIRVERNTAPAQ